MGESRVDVETGNEAEQEPEDCGYAVFRSWCAVCVKGRGVGKHLQVEPVEVEERERTTPMVAVDCVFLTPKNADVFPILICRDHVCGRTGATCCERKGPTAYSTSFLGGWRIFLKDENQPSRKVFQQAMIYSCVDVVVREMKKTMYNSQDFC